MLPRICKKEPRPALKISLPESKQAKAGANDAKPFVATIATNSPYLYLGDRPVTLDRLQNEMIAAVKKDPQVRVAIRPDKSSPIGEFFKDLDPANAANQSAEAVSPIADHAAPN